MSLERSFPGLFPNLWSSTTRYDCFIVPVDRPSNQKNTWPHAKQLYGELELTRLHWAWRRVSLACLYFCAAAFLKEEA